MNFDNFSETNVGIDTGQAMLDIYVRPQGDFQSFENNAEGIRAAIRFIKRFKPERVLIEATGRLEMDFFCAAHKARLPVCVCNPIQVRKFAQSLGRLAKTDKLDAQDIAYYGETMKPDLTELKPVKLRLLSDLLTVRSQCLDMSTMQKNRLQRMPKTVHKSIRNVLNAITKEITSIDRQLDKLVAEIPHYQERVDQLTSAKGVGNVLSYTLLSDLPVIRPEFSRHFSGSQNIAARKPSAPPDCYACVDALGCRTSRYIQT